VAATVQELIAALNAEGITTGVRELPPEAAA
jgi:hypothetical protein